jgi:hypothetical protein
MRLKENFWEKIYRGRFGNYIMNIQTRTKSKVGLVAAKASALRINLNIQGCSIVAPPLHALPLALPFFSPSFFHTISLSPAFTSA